MLKTTKYILTGVGVSAAGTGIYFVVNHYLSAPKKIAPVVNHPTRYYDTVPEPDSTLDKLNKILKDNRDITEHTKHISPISVEVYENIDKNSRLYDSLVQAGYISKVEDEAAVHHKEIFENTQSIKGDKFLSKRILRIFGKDESEPKDSLTGALAGIKPAGSKMFIEFWESPVNYKGYRLGRDKMIVFGIIPDEVKMVKYNGNLYLVTINNIFEVNPCTDFCQLRPIKDKALLENIMKHAN